MKAKGIMPGAKCLDLLDLSEPQIKKQASDIDKALQLGAGFPKGRLAWAVEKGDILYSFCQEKK